MSEEIMSEPMVAEQAAGGARYLGVGEETTVGTPVTATVYLPIQSESIRPDHRIFVVEDVRDRLFGRYKLGPFRNAGDIVMHIIPHGFTKFLKWTLGTVVSTQQGGTSAYKHDFSKASTLKSFTTRIGEVLKERVIAGCFVNTLELAGSLDLAMATVGIIGGEETSASIGTPSWIDATDPAYAQPFAFHQGAIKIDGVDKSAQVESIRITLNNNIPDRWSYGSRFERRADVGPLTVEGELGLAFLDQDQVNAFLTGTEFTLNAKWTGSLIATGYNYFIEVNATKCVYTTDTTPHIDRQEPLKLSAPFRCFGDITVSVQNKETTV